MTELIRRKDRHRADCWQIYFRRHPCRHHRQKRRQSERHAARQWHVGFYPGSNPGEQRGGTAPDFEQAREAFGTAWRVFSAKRTEADYQAWRFSPGEAVKAEAAKRGATAPAFTA